MELLDYLINDGKNPKTARYNIEICKEKEKGCHIVYYMLENANTNDLEPYFDYELIDIYHNYLVVSKPYKKLRNKDNNRTYVNITKAQQIARNRIIVERIQEGERLMDISKSMRINYNSVKNIARKYREGTLKL